MLHRDMLQLRRGQPPECQQHCVVESALHKAKSRKCFLVFRHMQEGVLHVVLV